MANAPSQPILRPEQIDRFAAEGYLHLPGFYPAAMIEEIQRDIHAIIGVVMADHGLPIERGPFAPEAFDAGFLEMLARDRALGGIVYDAVKQLPAFHRLLCCRANEALMSELRGSTLVGISHGGCGVRIDVPGESRYRTLWHQDYLSHFRSLDGVVLWAPLVEITEDLGPVEIVPGTHALGPLPLAPSQAQAPGGTHDYQLIAKSLVPVDARHLAEERGVVAPTSRPGDLLLLDFLTLHRSGANRGGRARWSMQLRWFNFEHPTGRRLGWRGGVASGITVADVHPELLVAGTG